MGVDKGKLLALAEAVEKLTGPDREADLAIHLAFNPDGDAATRIKFGIRGLTGESGQRWELSRGALLYEQRDDRGNCWVNGGIPIATYTASLDAAMTLVPEGLVMALTNAGTDDPVEPDFDTATALVFDWRATSGQPVIAATIPIALTAACLRARAQAETLA